MTTKKVSVVHTWSADTKVIKQKHNWADGGGFCSCGQDTFICQMCGKEKCADASLSHPRIEGVGNVCKNGRCREYGSQANKIGIETARGLATLFA
jgi:hypothetical protein